MLFLQMGHGESMLRLVLSGMKTGDRDAPEVPAKTNMKPTPFLSTMLLPTWSVAAAKNDWLINDGVRKKYVFLPSSDASDKLAMPYWKATFRILTRPLVALHW